MPEPKLLPQSMDFAVSIIHLVKHLKSQRESIISNQIGRSGTSIGANIREAQYANSRADFISKLQIALKEANETGYWLELLFPDELHFRSRIPIPRFRLYPHPRDADRIAQYRKSAYKITFPGGLPMSHSRFQTARKLLIFWTFFIGLGAVASAAAMLIDPSGRAGHGRHAAVFSGPSLRRRPFSELHLLRLGAADRQRPEQPDRRLPAPRKKKAGVVLGGVFGVTLMLWICIQFYIFP